MKDGGLDAQGYQSGSTFPGDCPVHHPIEDRFAACCERSGVSRFLFGGMGTALVRDADLLFRAVCGGDARLEASAVRGLCLSLIPSAPEIFGFPTNVSQCEQSVFVQQTLAKPLRL